MARTIDSARRVISGTWGELWIDGEKVAEVSACQAKVALNKETVNLCGRFMVLRDFDLREATITGTIVNDNPAFRRLLTQLKLTEPDVSNLDTSGGGEV